MKQFEFPAWIDHVGGVVNAAAILEVPLRLVQSWYSCYRTPGLLHCVNIIKKTDGSVTLDGIFRPAIRVRFGIELPALRAPA